MVFTLPPIDFHSDDLHRVKICMSQKKKYSRKLRNFSDFIPNMIGHDKISRNWNVMQFKLIDYSVQLTTWRGGLISPKIVRKSQLKFGQA